MKVRVIQWIPYWVGLDIDKVVWVSVEKLDASWRLDDYYIGPSGSGNAIAERYDKFGKWLALAEEPVWMCAVAINDDTDEISFTDGRHRFAWLRDHGVTAIQVQVPAEQAERIVARFSTTSRTSVLQRINF